MATKKQEQYGNSSISMLNDLLQNIWKHCAIVTHPTKCMHADGTEQVRNAMEAKSQEGYFPAVYHFPEKIISIT